MWHDESIRGRPGSAMKVRIPYSCAGTLEDSIDDLGLRNISKHETANRRGRAACRRPRSRSLRSARGRFAGDQTRNSRYSSPSAARSIRRRGSCPTPNRSAIPSLPSSPDPHKALWGLLWPRGPHRRGAPRHDYPRLFKWRQAGPAALIRGRNGALLHDHPCVVPWSWSTSPTPTAIGPTLTSPALPRRCRSVRCSLLLEATRSTTIRPAP